MATSGQAADQVVGAETDEVGDIGDEEEEVHLDCRSKIEDWQWGKGRPGDKVKRLECWIKCLDRETSAIITENCELRIRSEVWETWGPRDWEKVLELLMLRQNQYRLKIGRDGRISRPDEEGRFELKDETDLKWRAFPSRSFGLALSTTP